jgi:hypothetical protein
MMRNEQLNEHIPESTVIRLYLSRFPKSNLRRKKHENALIQKGMAAETLVLSSFKETDLGLSPNKKLKIETSSVKDDEQKGTDFYVTVPGQDLRLAVDVTATDSVEVLQKKMRVKKKSLLEGAPIPLFDYEHPNSNRKGEKFFPVVFVFSTVNLLRLLSFELREEKAAKKHVRFLFSYQIGEQLWMLKDYITSSADIDPRTKAHVTSRLKHAMRVMNEELSCSMQVLEVEEKKMLADDTSWKKLKEIFCQIYSS